MKSLKILTYSLIIMLAVTGEQARSQQWSLKTGIYEFTNITTREFYVLAPVIWGGYDVWTRSRISLHLSGGMGYKSRKYSEDRHHLYLIPFFFTANYTLPNPDARVYAVIGSGFSLMGKADQNMALDKTHYAITYGYHASGSLRFRLKCKPVLAVELTYNLLMPTVTEDINISGLIINFGIWIPVERNKDRKVKVKKDDI
ncbi:MAG: hypothetical protein HQ565_03205 [Bacteroidetes bacterium]|nr:hypothetical protein [Bacteroidota bacterium]